MHFLYEYDQEEHMRQIRQEGWQEGWQEGQREAAQLDDIRTITKTLNISVEKAMEALEIPEDKQAEYLTLLQK